MPDVVVTVPKGIWLDWIEEGDCPGDPPTGEEWGFSTWGARPNIARGERVYIVAHGKLRGYAPLTRYEFSAAGNQGRVVFGRAAGAVAVTIAESIRGFRGWRYRWWKREDEQPFPEWKTEGITKKRKLKGKHCEACGRWGIQHKPDGSWRCLYCGYGSSAQEKECPGCKIPFTPSSRHLKFPDGSIGADLCDDCFGRTFNPLKKQLAIKTRRESMMNSAKGRHRN